MSRRALLWFWASVAAATFLLGGAVSSAKNVFAGRGGGEGTVLFALSLVGLAAALFVAGRIAFVAGRIRRAARRR